jgi:hypothetical protein
VEEGGKALPGQRGLAGAAHRLEMEGRHKRLLFQVLPLIILEAAALAI